MNSATVQRPRHLELLEEAIAALESREDFQAWLNMRATFHAYSWRNTVLIQMQRPHATCVAGYQAWRTKHNRQVKKGERGITILAPLMRKKSAECEDGEEESARYVAGFRGVTVFDVSQTEGDPLPTPPAPAQLVGDSHEHLIAPLVEHAEAIGYPVAFETLSEGLNGLCDYRQNFIKIHDGLSPNAKVSTLIHELAHAHGATSIVHTRSGAEAIAESAAFVVCQSVGLDTTSKSVPYLAGWSTAEVRVRVLGEIDHYAAVLERVLGVHDRKTSLPIDQSEPELHASTSSIA